MGFGFVEIITLLLSLAGFGISANPKAPTVDQALEYAMPDADLVTHADVGALVGTNYKTFMNLADQPAIKASPELLAAVRQVTTQVEGGRGMLKNMVGVDPVTDVNDATTFVRFNATGKPDMVLASHGKYTPALVDKVAAMAHKTVQKIGATAEMVEVDNDQAVGVTKSNVLLVGKTALVKERLADTWKAPARAKDTALAYAADVIAGKPVLAVMMSLSAMARSHAIAMVQDGNTKENFATDLLRRHKMAAFEVYPNGIGWNWIDTKAGGVEQMQMMAEGVVEVFRAAQIAPRGATKIVLAGLESYRGTDKRVDEVLRQKANVLKIVDEFTGDGKFDAKITKVGANRLDVRLTGKSISEVVPFSLAMPVIGALTFVTGRKSAAVSPPMVMPQAVQPATPPHNGLHH